MRLFILFLLSIGLAACTPSYFGLSKEQWEQLTPAQQNEVIKAYNEREAERQRAENEQNIIAEQNAPLNNLIGALSAAVPQHTKEKKRSTTTQNKTCNADGTHCTSTSTTRSSGWQIGY
ncbi:hypothetical protein [Legionella nagasakiensis]|uniref:hypothetical protein n=1 Tax=Legionella nagasakiensis TaxID=535290 RepID=UPI0010551E2A|nr:hypothetical protein [Legionella nagasakiensis]